MEIREKLAEAVKNAALKANMSDVPPVELEEPPKKEMGDFATNFAMKSARVFKMNPRKIAEEIVSRLEFEELDHAEIAGPGFINFYLKKDVLASELAAAIKAGDEFGNLPEKKNLKIQVEYVSANPTGPLHVGHGRGAAFGSALVNLLRAAGYDVSAEYYINDAGSQIDNLAASVNARYLELFGEKREFLDTWYRGADIIETAKRIKDADGDKFLKMPEEERIKIFRERALNEKLEALKRDLEDFRVKFDVWFSERTLHPDKVNASVSELREKGAIYENDGALWLRSTDYGDDKDRVVIRRGGEPTYLASDIAYHRDKFARNFDEVINIWGSDHHGYIARVKAALTALGIDAGRLAIILLQMVSLYRGGELVKMSKRTGQSVTLAELIEEVGADAARYFFVMRSPDSQLDFDIDLAKSESNENPVYYVQYAHARIMSIFRQAEEIGLAAGGDLSLLNDESEISLIKKIISYPGEIERAARDRAPQRIARFAHEIAGEFHSFYTRCRIIGAEEPLAGARLALAGKTAAVIRHALGIIGVSAPDRM